MSDKDEIFDYVMNNPENTNPAILRGMLNDLGGGSVIFASATGSDQLTLSMSYSEVNTAITSGNMIFMLNTDSIFILSRLGYNEENQVYWVRFVNVEAPEKSRNDFYAIDENSPLQTAIGSQEGNPGR